MKFTLEWKIVQESVKKKRKKENDHKNISAKKKGSFIGKHAHVRQYEC